MPSDRLHSQVTTEVIFAFMHLLGAVGQESCELWLQHTAVSGEEWPSLVSGAAGAGCCHWISQGWLPQAGSIPSSVLHVYWWLQEFNVCLLVAAGAAEDQAELESCHRSLHSQAGSCSTPYQAAASREHGVHSADASRSTVWWWPS